jgi:hypothetical protein
MCNSKNPRASGLTSRRHTVLEDQHASRCRVGDNEESELIRSAKPLLLDSLNLDDDSILDDHTDFTEANAFYGCPHMIQVQVAGGRGVDGSSIIESGKSLF